MSVEMIGQARVRGSIAALQSAGIFWRVSTKDPGRCYYALRPLPIGCFSPSPDCKLQRHRRLITNNVDIEKDSSCSGYLLLVFG